MRGIITIGVVLAVIVIAIGLLIPSVGRVREAAAVVQCQNNLKQIALALHTYRDTDGTFPPAVMPHPDLPPERRLSWQVAILPYVECDTTYSSMKKDEPWDSEANRVIAATLLRYYRCPGNGNAAGAGEPALTHYVGLGGVGPDAAELPLKHPRAGFFGYARTIGVEDVTDGMSNTIAVIETASDNGPWAAGGAATVRGIDPDEAPHVGRGRPFGSTHNVQRPFPRTPPAVANVAMGDASTRRITDGISATTLRALATIAGQDEVGDDF